VDLRHSRPALRQIEHLSRVKQPVELVQQLGALVAAALRVDEDEQRLGLLRRYRLDDEDLAGGGRRRDGLDRQRSAAAVAARRAAAAAAAAAAVTLLHRRFPTTSNRRLERTLHEDPEKTSKINILEFFHVISCRRYFDTFGSATGKNLTVFRIDNFAMVSGRKGCDMSTVFKFCL